MKKNHLIMRIGFGIMLITMLVCIMINYYTTLVDPVFMRYCIETPSMGQADSTNTLLQLKYITNSTDTRMVVGINFLEAPELSYIATEVPYYDTSFNFYNKPASQFGWNFEKYSIHTVYLYQSNCFSNQWKGVKELNNALIQFSDGSTMKVDLGRIILYSDPVGIDSLTNISTSTTSDNFAGVYSSYSSFKVNHDLTLQNLFSPLLTDAPPSLKIIVNNVDYKLVSGMEYKKNSNFYITTEFNNSKENQFDVYDIKPILNYQNSNSTAGFIRVYSNIYQPQFYTTNDIVKYLRGRGAF